MQVFAAGLKPELAYGLGMGGQTELQVRSQVRSQVVNFKHIQMTCDQRVSTCVRI